MKLNNPIYSKSPRLITNKTFSFLKAEEIKTFDDLLLIIEFSSTLYKNIFWKFYEYHTYVNQKIWKGVYKSIDTIAKEVGCSEKTIDRFIRDRDFLLQHQRRSKNGKQENSHYFMPSHIQHFCKAFWKVGLFKSKEDFGRKLKFLKMMWEKSGFDFQQLMKLLTTREQNERKMSLGNNSKCPSSIYSKLLSLNSTYQVPPNEAKKVIGWIQSLIRRSMEDVKWYSLEKKKKIDNFEAFFKSRFKSCFA